MLPSRVKTGYGSIGCHIEFLGSILTVIAGATYGPFIGSMVSVLGATLGCQRRTSNRALSGI